MFERFWQLKRHEAKLTMKTKTGSIYICFEFLLCCDRVSGYSVHLEPFLFVLVENEMTAMYIC